MYILDIKRKAHLSFVDIKALAPSKIPSIMTVRLLSRNK
jgi:hypothetical protein